MTEEGKKELDENGVLIKKKTDSANKSGKDEIFIDALDSGSKTSTKPAAESGGKKPAAGHPEKTDDEAVVSPLEAKGIIEKQKKELEEKNMLLAEYEDLLKRKQAEFENYRKRMARESEDFKKFAVSEMVLDIVTVIDNFERALSAAEATKDFGALHEGIIMIEKQLKDILEKKYEVKMIETVGKEFDPTLHDAIMMEESQKYDEDTVIEDFQKGYIMHDRVIRPAKVKVAKAVSPAGEQSKDQSE